MVVPDSTWNRFLQPDGANSSWWKLPGIVVLLGLLLLLKPNFYFFGIYIFFYFAWRLVYKKTVFSKSVLIRVVLIALAGISVFVGIRLVDSSIQDFQKSERVMDAREKYAGELFKPSTPLDKKYAYLQMKERGVTLDTILHRHNWGEKIFRTSFGEYGYTSVAASYEYYDFVHYLTIIVFIVIAFFTMKNGGWEGVSLLIVTMGSALLLVIASLYQAWGVDFQAQGRYLLPVLGMFSMFSYHMREKLGNLPCVLVLSSMFMVSLYSFIFVALAGISKVTLALG